VLCNIHRNNETAGIAYLMIDTGSFSGQSERACHGFGKALEIADSGDQNVLIAPSLQVAEYT